MLLPLKYKNGDKKIDFKIKYKTVYIINNIILNDNDEKLLSFCKDRPKSIREIAEHLKIAPKNVSVRLEKLEKIKLIKVKKTGKGKKTFVRSILFIENNKLLKVKNDKN